jgi:hypothetical protein
MQEHVIVAMKATLPRASVLSSQIGASTSKYWGSFTWKISMEECRKYGISSETLLWIKN